MIRTRRNGPSTLGRAERAATLARADLRAATRRANGGGPPRSRMVVQKAGPKRVARRPAILPGVVLAIGLYGMFFLPGHLLYAASTAMVAGLIGLALYLPLAALRELPLNSAGLAGLSAYLFAYYGSAGGLGHNLGGIAVALLVVTGLSVLGGCASLAVTGLYFAVATLVIQIGIEKVVFSIPELTGGAAGRSVYQPAFTGFFNTQRTIYLVVGAICLTCTLIVWRLKSKRVLFRAVAVGWAPLGATASGLRSWVQKLGIFAVSGLLIGIAGCLSAFVNGTPPPTVAFNVVWSVIFLAIPIASGLRDISSVWLVAAGFTALPIILESHHINTNLLSGLILLGALMASQSRDALGRLRRTLMAALSPGGEEIDLAGVADVAPEALEAATAQLTVNGERAELAKARPASKRPSQVLLGSDLSVTFGGIKAVQDVSVRVAPGRRVGIVGANGAGKTTLFNAITGFVPIVSGEIHLGERDLTHVPAFARARAGLRRSFQLPRLADILTLWQNVILGQGAPAADVEERAEWLLGRLGLLPLKDVPIGAVPFGVRREVEIIRALAQEPEVLMLDEPVSGLEDHEVTRLLEVLLDLQATEGWGLLVIEHDLRFITGIAEYLMVMEAGALLTDGPVQDVLRDERVRRVYLGEVETV